jgi:SAM-dependent methyltransferase
MQQRTNSEVLVELVPLKDRLVADVGCGDGALVRLMARRGAFAIGIDCTREQIEAAQAAPPAGSEVYVEAVGEALPLKAACLDAVVFFNALHHVPVAVQGAALAETRRVLKPGGVAYIAEPLAEGPNFELVRLVEDETEVRAHAYAAIKEAARNGLREETEITYVHTMMFANYEAFRDRNVRIDPKRRPIVERLDTELRARFHGLGRPTPDGFGFDQPMRVNLLRKA